METILAIEDDKVARELVRRALEPVPYRVITAEDGNEGLRTVFTNRPDLILLDRILPGLDGLELLRILKENEEVRKIPVIIVSSRRDTEKKVRGLDLGADDYITKPFEVEELRARVAVQFRIQRLRRELVEAGSCRAIVELAGAAAHQLNQPLTIIMTRIELLKEVCPHDHPNLKSLNAIYTAAEEMVDIIHKLQNIRRYETMDYTKRARIVDIDKASTLT